MIELVNEGLIIMLTVVLVIFTDFVDDVDLQYKVGGWAYVGLMGLCILFNMFFIIMDLVQKCLLITKKKYKQKFPTKKKVETKKKEVKVESNVINIFYGDNTQMRSQNIDIELMI